MTSQNHMEKFNRIEGIINDQKSTIQCGQKQAAVVRERVAALQLSVLNSHKNFEQLEEQLKAFRQDQRVFEEQLIQQPAVMKKKSSDERVWFSNSSGGEASLTLSQSGLNSGTAILHSDVKTIRISSSSEDEPSVFSRVQAAKSLQIEELPNVRSSFGDSEGSWSERKSVYQVDS